MPIIVLDIENENPPITNSELVKIIDFVPDDESASSTNLYTDDRMDFYTDLNVLTDALNNGSGSIDTGQTTQPSTSTATQESQQLKKEKAKEKLNQKPDQAPATVQNNMEILSEINKVVPDVELAVLIKKVLAIPDIPQYVKEFIPIMVKKPYNLNTAGRLAHFFGQIHVETKWKSRSEGVDYKGSHLKDVFGNHIKDKDEAIKLGINGTGARPNQVGGWPDIVYGNRQQNERQGNKYGTLDGYKYRGHGLLQISFKNPYYKKMTELFPAEDFINNPDKINEPKWSLISSLLWWVNHKGVYIDTVNDETVRIVSKAVNGHNHNLNDRIKFTHNYYNQLK